MKTKSRNGQRDADTLTLAAVPTKPRRTGLSERDTHRAGARASRKTGGQSARDTLSSAASEATGLATSETRKRSARRTKPAAVGLRSDDIQGKVADGSTKKPDGAGQQSGDAPIRSARPSAFSTPLSRGIRELSIRRKAVGKMLRAVDSVLLAAVRNMLGYSTHDDEDKRKELCTAAQAIIDSIDYGKPAPEGYERLTADLTSLVLGKREAMRAFVAERKKLEELLRADAEKHPACAWWMSHRGLAPLGLATLIGECGEPGDYRNPSSLWKRMGVAVMGGKRQGNPGTGATADDWIAHGYAAERRSALWTIGTSILYAQHGENVGYFRQVYNDRKVFERQKNVAAGAKDPDKYTHARAKRYMEKRLLRLLWSECRKNARGGGQATVGTRVPAAVATA